MKISEIKEALAATYRQPAAKRRPLFIKGRPGIGKSDAPRQVAGELGIGFMSLQATIEDPITLSGLPARDGDHARFLPFTDKLPSEGDGVIVIDEINCFPPGTPVAIVDLETGERREVAIETVEVGQLVICSDLNSNRTRVKLCLGRIAHTATELFTAETSDGRSLTATEHHHVYTDRGWVKISELRPGDSLYRLPNMRQAVGRDHGAALGAAQHDDSAVRQRLPWTADAAGRDAQDSARKSRSYDPSRSRGYGTSSPIWGTADSQHGGAVPGRTSGLVTAIGSDLSGAVFAGGTVADEPSRRPDNGGAASRALHRGSQEGCGVLALAGGTRVSLGASVGLVVGAGAPRECFGQEPHARDQRTYHAAVPIHAPDRQRKAPDRTDSEGRASSSLCGGRGVSDTDRGGRATLAQPGFRRYRSAQGGSAGRTIAAEHARLGGIGLPPGGMGGLARCGARDGRREVAFPQAAPLHRVSVVRVRRHAYAGPVYDLTVADEHNYFASGFLVHNSAPPAVQAGLYELFLNGKLGSYRLPTGDGEPGRGWYVCATGNLDTDRAVTSRMPTPLVSRLVHVHAETDLNTWITWALDHDIRPEVIAFLNFRSAEPVDGIPDIFMTFDPARGAVPFACPRTYHMASDILDTGHGAAIEHELLRGALGDGPATELSAFLRVYRDLVNPDAILMDPEHAAIPEGGGALYAVCGALARKASADNIDRLSVYLLRLPAEFAVSTIVQFVKRDPTLQHTPAYLRLCHRYGDILTGG